MHIRVANRRKEIAERGDGAPQRRWRACAPSGVRAGAGWRDCRRARGIVCDIGLDRRPSRRRGPVAQWLEPAAHNGLVGGSNPPGPTNNINVQPARLVSDVEVARNRRDESKISPYEEVHTGVHVYRSRASTGLRAASLGLDNGVTAIVMKERQFWNFVSFNPQPRSLGPRSWAI
jgi:hypothetical protein